jgi:hypothetical protein
MRIRLMAATALIPLLAACGGSSSGGGPTVDGSAGGGNPAAGGGAAASCVAPTLTVRPTKAHPGEDLRVSGEWYADGCNDTAVNGESPQPPPPFTGMTIELHQGDKTWPVATDVDAAGERYSFDVTVTVPKDADAGKATIQAKDHGFATDLEIVTG